MSALHLALPETARQRALLLDRCAKEQAVRAKVLERCRHDDVFFIQTFLFTFDPRPHAPMPDLPFFLYDFQIDKIINELNSALAQGEDRYWEKSRDMGFTWTFLAWAFHKWLFRRGTQILLGSRKEDLVDNRDLDSHFGKIDYFLRKLPGWFMAAALPGWNPKEHRQKLRLVNPNRVDGEVRGNTLRGESANAEFARQGRYTCLVGGTYVPSPYGLLSFEEHLAQVTPSLGGRAGEARRVRGYLVRPPETVYTVTGQYGYQVTGTADHPLRVLRDGAEQDIRLADLTTDDWLLIPSLADADLSQTTPIDHDVARVLGYLVSEGTVNRPARVEFCQKDPAIMADFCDAWRRAFDNDLPVREQSNTINGQPVTWQVAGGSRAAIRRRLAELGLDYAKAAGKSVPRAIRGADRATMRAFLQALFEGDGGAYCYPELKTLRVHYTSKSETLVRQLQSLLLFFGIVSSVRMERRRQTWKLVIGNAEAAKFGELIGFRSARKNDPFQHYVTTGATRAGYGEWQNGVLPVRVTQIVEAAPVTTYDCELDGHLFVANGVLSHNCVFMDEGAFWPDFSSAFRAAGLTTASRFCGSTPNGMNAWGKLMHNPAVAPRKITLHWRLHPLHDEEWYRRECAHLVDVETIAQELDLNYQRSTKGRVYPAWENCQFGPYPYMPGWARFVSWDFGLDGTAIIWWQRDPVTGQIRMLDCYQNTQKPLTWYVPFVTGELTGDNPHLRDYSADELAKMAEHAVWGDGRRWVHFGDPSVKQRNLTDGKSPLDLLKSHGIFVVTNDQARDFKTRKRFTDLGLAGLQVNLPEEGAVGCWGVDDAMRLSRYPARNPDSQFTSEVVRPVHDEHSHYRTAVEYFFTNVPPHSRFRRPAAQESQMAYDRMFERRR